MNMCAAAPKSGTRRRSPSIRIFVIWKRMIKSHCCCRGRNWIIRFFVCSRTEKWQAGEGSEPTEKWMGWKWMNDSVWAAVFEWCEWNCMNEIQVLGYTRTHTHKMTHTKLTKSNNNSNRKATAVEKLKLRIVWTMQKCVIHKQQRIYNMRLYHAKHTFSAMAYMHLQTYPNHCGSFNAFYI